MHTHTLRLVTSTRVALVFALALTLLACSSAQVPQTLQQAKDLIDSSGTERLNDAHPNLVYKARQYEERAWRAFYDGDLDKAELYAHLAIQHHQTAVHFDARDMAQAKRKAMKRALSNIETQVASLKRESQALQLFQERNNEFEQLQNAAKAPATPQEDPKASEARKVILTARQRQSDAIGAGAPNAAKDVYEQGRFLISTALDALRDGEYDASMDASYKAIDRFDAAIIASKDSEANQRRVEKKRAEASQSDDKKRLLAERAVSDAQSAKAGAIAQKMEELQPEQFKKANYILSLAEEKLKSKQYPSSQIQAEEATGIYQNFQKNDAKPGQQNAPQAIAQAEDARVAALGQGADGPKLQQADYTLQLARDAVKDDNDVRATQLANKAKELYVALLPKPTPGSAELVGQTGPANTPSSKFRKEVESLLVQTKIVRAEAFGQGLDRSCADRFREFEALLQLAQDRYDANDLTQTVTLVTKATERLKQCDAEASTTRRAPAAAANRAEPKDDARDKATASLAEAQRTFAALSSDPTRSKELQEPALLLADAQQWYEKRVWDESLKSSTRCIALMKDVQKNAPVAKSATASTKPVAETPKECKGFDQKERKTRIAQNAASGKIKDKETRLDFERGSNLFLSAKDLSNQGLCKEADLFYTEANSAFDGVINPPKTAPVAAAQTTAKEAQPCTNLQEEGRAAQIAQGAASGKLEGKEDRERFERASNIYLSAQDFSKKGFCPEAKTLFISSTGLFNELAQPRAAASASAALGQTGGNQAKTAVNPESVRAAKSAIARAQIARAKHTDQSSSPVFQTADSLLSESQQLLRAEKPEESLALATQAAGAFEALAPVAKGATPKDVSWKPAYGQAIDALSARDRSAEVIGSEREKNAFDRGVRLLSSARAAWDKKDYQGAQSMSASAQKEFDSIFVMAAEREKAQSKESEEERKAREAREKALRANAQKQIDEAERLKAEAAADREKADAARAAAAERDRKAKEEAARLKTEMEAREKAAAEREKAAANFQKANAAERKLFLDTSKLLREAELAWASCKSAGCKTRNETAFTSAEGELQKARALLAAGNYKDSENASNTAQKGFQVILDEITSFSIPQSVSRVKVVGNQLILNPKLNFRSGSTRLTPDSQKSLDELVKVIQVNRTRLSKVALIGFTDDRGSDTANLKLSKDRAAAIKVQLIRKGIPSELLESLGRGEADPIATNEDPNGREINRRVEIHLTFK